MSMRKGRILAVLCCVLLALLWVPPAYAAESAALQLEIDLDITGDAPASAESFTFVLEAVGDAPMPENHRVTITGTGIGSFSSITYTDPETYHYTVRQEAGQAEGYVYDGTVYDLTVQVTTSDTGALKTAVWASARGSTQKTDQILFTNQYRGPEPQNPEPQNPGPQNPGQTPQTGDTSNMALWSVLCLAGLLGLIALITYHVKVERPKKEQEKP